jgi:alkylation response protein AidB-like acyl-CoA dehydrogenase
MIGVADAALAQAVAYAKQRVRFRRKYTLASAARGTSMRQGA